MSIKDYSSKTLSVLVCVEEFNKTESSVIFDFADSNEFAEFIDIFGLQYDMDKPSMVFLKNYKQRRLTENTYYYLDLETIKSLTESGELFTDNQNSYLIGFTFDVENVQNKIFGEAVGLKKLEDLIGSIYPNHKIGLSDYFFPKLKNVGINVRNVGHGNWNEVLSGNDVKIVFDAGASSFASQAEIIKIIASKITDYKNTNPVLILSHWDKDHYHSLLGMSDNDLVNFSSFICRDLLPNLTSRKLFSRIERALGTQNVFTIKANTKNKKRGVCVFKNLNPTSDQVVLYNSEEHKNRNISGLILTIKSRNHSVIFSGDCHYGQISRDILPHLNFKHQNHLVVPHHGGNSGKFIYDKSSRITFGQALISWGKNNYNHPTTKNVQHLKTTFNTLKQTLKDGDIYIGLYK